MYREANLPVDMWARFPSIGTEACLHRRRSVDPILDALALEPVFRTTTLDSVDLRSQHVGANLPSSSDKRGYFPQAELRAMTVA